MKHILAFFLFALGCNLSFSQGGEFRPGKIVDLKGDTIVVEIQYENWVVTPKSIVYRSNKEGALKEVFPGQIKSFSILNLSTYISVTARIDQSSNLENYLSYTKLPDWVVQTVFLKELLVSSVSLYKYKTSDYTRFFYKKYSSPNYEQLIYKKFRYFGDERLVNVTFKKQLLDNFDCDLKSSDLKRIDYYESDLIKFFTKFNTCSGNPVKESISKEAKGLLKFNLKAGVSLVNGSFKRKEIFFASVEEVSSDFNSAGLRADLEIEYLTPFYNRRLAVLFNIGLDRFQTEGALPDQILRNIRGTATRRIDQPWSLDYTQLALGLGVRKYVPVNNSTEFFLDFLVQPIVNFSKKYDYEFAVIEDFVPFNPNLNELNKVNFGLGLGIKFNSFYIHGRYFTSKEIINKIIGSAYSLSFNNVAIQLGYRLN